MCVSEIRVKRIRVNQGLGVHMYKLYLETMKLSGHWPWNFCAPVQITVTFSIM